MIDTPMFELEDFTPAPVFSGRQELLGFTRAFFTAAEFDEAAPFLSRRHNWTRSAGMVIDRSPAGCQLVEYRADLRCTVGLHGGRMFWRQPTPEHLWKKYGEGDADARCQCVGELVTMASCERCAWNHVDTEAGALLAWLDHAWPGWRDLPLIPAEIQPPYGGALRPKNGSPNPDDVRAGKASHAWAVENYPAEWQIPGAPARAERDGAGRGVIPGYSPFGGLLVRTVAA